MKNPYLVKDFKILEDYKMLITFTYDEKKVFDFRTLLNDKYYQKLNDYNFFKQAHKQGFSIAWNDKIDINPELLYEEGTLYNE